MSKKRKFTGRLNCQEYKETSNMKEYLASWTKDLRYVQKQLPELKCIGFDPSFLCSYGSRGMAFELPPSFISDMAKRMRTGKPLPKPKPVSPPK